MASIPLPALDIKAPQQPDLLEKFGQLSALRNAQQEYQQRAALAPLQQAQAQQAVQSGGVELQQKQQALKDQQATTAAMHEWDGNLDNLPGLILKHGGSSTAVMAIKTQALEQKAKYAQIAKDDAETGKNQIDTQKQKNDLISGALSAVMQTPDAQLPQALTQTAQDLVQKGLLDPQHAQLAAQLAQSGNPAQIRQQLDLFRKSYMSDTQLLDEAQKKVTTAKDQAQLDFYAKNGGAPGVPIEQQQQADWLSKHPGKGPADFAVAQAANKAGAEEAARLPGEMRLAAQKQALSQGDPNQAAQLLINGDATLSELKARGSTPDFIARTLFAANKLSGGKYNAQSADAQFKVAQSPAQVQFFGSAKSLTDKGGTLDQLAEAAKAIPGNQIPVFNTLADAEKAATGNGPVAKYASLLVGVADDYSKVMGGGTGSDSSRAQALHLVPANASPEARAAAIEGIRGAVGSQINSRIGNNTILKRMYGGSGAATAPAPQTHSFSLSAWQKANPNGDPNAAKAAAQQAGYQVVQ